MKQSVIKTKPRLIYSLSSKLLGDPETTSLENRVFNTVALLVSLTGVVTLIQNSVTGVQFVHNLLSIITLVAGIIFYICFGQTKKHKSAAVPMYVFFLCLLVANWFFTYGSKGAGSFFFLILLISGVILFHQSNNVVLLVGSTPVAIGLLFIVEYFYPATIIASYDNEFQLFLDKGISLLLSLFVNGMLVYLVTREYQLERGRNEQLLKQTLEDKAKLEKALREIRLLKGLLPICATCKKIRDDEGFWHQVERYIMDHSEAEFTHGICPDCKSNYLAELAAEMNNSPDPNQSL